MAYVDVGRLQCRRWMRVLEHFLPEGHGVRDEEELAKALALLAWVLEGFRPLVGS